jgi:hypothetical protein
VKAHDDLAVAAEHRAEQKASSQVPPGPSLISTRLASRLDWPAGSCSCHLCSACVLGAIGLWRDTGIACLVAPVPRRALRQPQALCDSGQLKVTQRYALTMPVDGLPVYGRGRLAHGDRLPEPSCGLQDKAEVGQGCAYAPRCPLVVDRCRAESPVLRPIGKGYAACHRAEDMASSAVLPGATP